VLPKKTGGELSVADTGDWRSKKRERQLILERLIFGETLKGNTSSGEKNAVSRPRGQKGAQ